MGGSKSYKNLRQKNFFHLKFENLEKISESKINKKKSIFQWLKKKSIFFLNY